MSTPVYTYSSAVAEALAPANSESPAVVSSTSADLVFKITMYIGIGVIGLCGNGFAIYVIMNTKAMRKKIANRLVVNQSVIDCCASIWLIFDMTGSAMGTHYKGLAGDLRCRIWSGAFLMWVTFVSSTYNLVLISLERYLGVCHPVWHLKYFTRRVAIGCMVVPWLMGLVVEGHIPLTSSVKNGECIMYQFPTPLAQKVNGIFITLFGFILPFLFMIFCYLSMACSIHSKRPTTSNTRKRKSEKNVLKTLVILCACFGLCHLISQVNYLCFNFAYTLDFQAWYFYMGVMGVNINCCINPFIYAFKYEAFQVGMKRIILRKGAIGPEETGSTQATSMVSTIPKTSQNVTARGIGNNEG